MFSRLDAFYVGIDRFYVIVAVCVIDDDEVVRVLCLNLYLRESVVCRYYGFIE